MMLSGIDHVTAHLYGLRVKLPHEKPNKAHARRGGGGAHGGRQEFTGSALGSEDHVHQYSLSPGNKNAGAYLRGPDDAHSKQQCGQRAHSGFKREAAKERDKKV